METGFKKYKMCGLIWDISWWLFISLKFLQDKIQALETQNKTLAAQLRRLHQIVVNGGLRQGGQGQRSTALMVLLLSTALFLIPGVRDQVRCETHIHGY